MSDEDYTRRESMLCVFSRMFTLAGLRVKEERARTYSVYSRQCGFVLVVFLCPSTWLKQGELLLFQQQLARMQTWE